jgi:N-acetylglucosaminyldiphosphoundecaprenol N-acetyl-beta-D-mannosaminyltransferase
MAYRTRLAALHRIPDGSAARAPREHANHGAIRAGNALAPDYLWVALAVPPEQAFVEEFTPDRSNVGVLKTSGGPFDLLSGSRARAPLLEWARRIRLEPRRLFWRYLTTNPRALYLLLN